MKVAIAQISPELADLDANFKKHLHYIQLAKKQGVNLLIFPELSLTGYAIRENTLNVLLKRDDPRLLSLAKEAGDLTVIVGAVEEAVAASFYNAGIILRRGKVVFIHRKLNLPTYGLLEEGKYFSSGRYVETYQFDPDWRLATLICADVWNPSLVHLAALHGATMLIIPLNSADGTIHEEFSNPDVWVRLVEFYATIYGMPVLAANRCGEEHGLQFWGKSLIVSPHGKILVQANEDQEELIVADLDFDTVKKARFQLPTVRDSNFSVVYREMQRLDAKLGVPDIVRDE